MSALLEPHRERRALLEHTEHQLPIATAGLAQRRLGLANTRIRYSYSCFSLTQEPIIGYADGTIELQALPNRQIRRITALGAMYGSTGVGCPA